MSRHEYRSEPVRITDESNILHQAFGLHASKATLPDGSTGRAVDEDRDEADARAVYNAHADRARDDD